MYGLYLFLGLSLSFEGFYLSLMISQSSYGFGQIRKSSYISEYLHGFSSIIFIYTYYIVTYLSRYFTQKIKRRLPPGY